MSFLGGIGKALGGLFGVEEIPAVQITTAESKVQAYDPRAPRSLCLGRSAWTMTVGWRKEHDFGTGNSTPRECLTEVLVAGDHPMGALEEILIDEKIYTIGNNAGENGDDFVPKSVHNATANFDYQSEIPNDWYVPNSESGHSKTRRFHRVDGGDKRCVMCFKWYDGTQTTQLRSDGWLQHIDGWDSRTRDFRNMGCLVVAWRRGINEEVFSGNVPRLLPICQGAQNVRNWSLASTGYTDKLVPALTHWLMWEYGPFQEVNDSWTHVGWTVADWDATLLAAEQAVCAETVPDAGDRYDVSYQIHSGQDPQEVFDTFDFCGGGIRVWRRLNGKWGVRVGHDRASVVHFDLDDPRSGVGDSIVVRRHRPHADKFNTITVGYISETNLYEMMEADRSDGTYRNADGAKLFETITNRGRHFKDSNQRLALIKLDRHRLEEGISFDCWYRFGTDTSGGSGGAIKCEPGDIATITYSRRGWFNKEFEIIAKPSTNINTGKVRIECDEWGGIRFEGEGDTPEEVGDDVGKWDGHLPPPTGLTVVDIDQPTTTQPDGSLVVTVLVDCDDHPEDALIRFLGHYAFRWRISGSGSGYTNIIADESRAFASVKVGKTYEFEARVVTTAGGKTTKSEWSGGFTVTIDSDFLALPAPVSSTNQAHNLIADSDFDQSAGFGPDDSPYWDGTPSASQNGSVIFASTGGKTSPPNVLITADGTTDQSVYSRARLRVQAGQVFRLGLWVIVQGGPWTNPTYSVKLIGRDSKGEFLLGADDFLVDEVYNVNVWKRVERIVQLPYGVFPQIEPLESLATATGTTTTLSFPTVASPGEFNHAVAIVAVNAQVTTETDPTGETGGNWFFNARRITATGDDVSLLLYGGDITGATVAGGAVTLNAGTRWVMVAGALSGVDLTGTPQFSEAGTAATPQTNPATNLAVPYTGVASPYQGALLVAYVAIHADSGHSCVPVDTNAWGLMESRAAGDMSVYAFRKIVEGDETGTAAFNWGGTGGAPVCHGFMVRYDFVGSDVVQANIELRARQGTNGSAFRFDRVTLIPEQILQTVVNNAIIGPYPSVTIGGGGRRTVMKSQYHYAPPHGVDAQIEVNFRYRLRRIEGQGTGSTGTFYVEVRRQKASDDSEVTILGSTELDIFRKGDDGETLWGHAHIRVADDYSTAFQPQSKERYRYRVIARVESSVSGDDFEWIVKMRRLVIRFSASDETTESGGDVVS